MYEKVLNEESVNDDKKIKMSINFNFEEEFDNWDKKDRIGNFVLGNTSKALKSIGLDKKDIVIDKSKLKNIINSHPQMTPEIIKRIPQILENPTLILKSQSVKGRLVLFGKINTDNGKPVLVAMELNPDENNNLNAEKIYKVASSYGRNNMSTVNEWLKDQSNILYIDSKKNRTKKWLAGLGLQLPVPTNQISSNDGIISQNNNNVNSIKNSIKDNKEKNLTVEQQEYFKVRYKKGKLEVMYRGYTSKVINVFDKNKSKKSNLYNQKTDKAYVINFSIENLENENNSLC